MAEKEKKNEVTQTESGEKTSPQIEETRKLPFEGGRATREELVKASLHANDTVVADKVDAEAREATQKAESKENAKMAESNDMIMMLAEAIKGANAQVGYAQAVPGASEVVPGGRYIYNDRVVNADGQVLEATPEEKKTIEDTMKMRARATRQAYELGGDEGKDLGEL